MFNVDVVELVRSSLKACPFRKVSVESVTLSWCDDEGCRYQAHWNTVTDENGNILLSKLFDAMKADLTDAEPYIEDGVLMITMKSNNCHGQFALTIPLIDDDCDDEDDEEVPSEEVSSEEVEVKDTEHRCSGSCCKNDCCKDNKHGCADIVKKSCNLPADEMVS